MAEWLGNGLQNRVQQFDSAWYLLQHCGLFLFDASLLPQDCLSGTGFTAAYTIVGLHFRTQSPLLNCFQSVICYLGYRLGRQTIMGL